AEVSRPERIEGIATLTIVTSSSDMNPTARVTARTRQRAGSGSVTVASPLRPSGVTSSPLVTRPMLGLGGVTAVPVSGTGRYTPGMTSTTIKVSKDTRDR